MIKSPDCKKCRRVGTKLFLKGEKCDSQKCPMIKKPYAPGEKPKKRKGRVSQYGVELIEKQKLRYWYYIKEKQFVRYIKSAMEKKSGADGTKENLLRTLEGRLDNFVYRAGFASSRIEAKQMVNHRFFYVNGKPVDVPSYQVKKGDVISVRDSKKKTKNFVDFKTRMKNFNPPSWISLNKEKIEAKITGEVVVEEIAPPVEISSIFEFYSR
jgi:small subunit ribosomal protein S4